MPVAISYKVCIFAMTGNVYADNAKIVDFGDRKGFREYNQGYYTNILGGYKLSGNDKYKDDPKYGLSAAENLNYRVKTTSQDNTVGLVKKWTTMTGYGDSKGCDWNGSDFKKVSRATNALEKCSTRIPMLPYGCTCDIKQDCMILSKEKPSPMYLPDRFIVTDKDGEEAEGEQSLMVGESLDIDKSYIVDCLDAGGVHYYDFDKNHGEWFLCDSDGNIKNDDENISIERKSIGSRDQVIKTKKVGTSYVTWNLKEKDDKGNPIEYRASEQNGAVTCKTPMSDVPRPIIEITVSDTPLKYLKWKMKDGVTWDWRVGDKDLDLNNVFRITAINGDDEEVDVSTFIWRSREQYEGSGIIVKEDGTASFTKPGEYEIRPIVGSGKNAVSTKKWIVITIGEEGSEELPAPPRDGDPIDTATGFSTGRIALAIGITAMVALILGIAGTVLYRRRKR